MDQGQANQQEEQVLAILDSKDLRKAKWLQAKKNAIETAFEKLHILYTNYHQEHNEFMGYLTQKYDIPDDAYPFVMNLNTGSISKVSIKNG